MAGAYAALLSLTHLLEDIQHSSYCQRPISLDENDINLMDSLGEMVPLLLDFLEGYSYIGDKEARDLEIRIRNTVHVVEDVIESHLMDQLRDISDARASRQEKCSRSLFRKWIRGGKHKEKETNYIPFPQDLKKVMERMDSIKEEVTKIKEARRIQDQQPVDSLISLGSSNVPPTRTNTMIGFEDCLIQILDKLTGEGSSRSIIPISGMGGIGKTTLAINVHYHPLIVQHFDIRAWVTVSQEYSVVNILLDLLKQMGVHIDEEKENLREDQLSERVYKMLYGRRYLITMDDVWGIDVWEKAKTFLPDKSNGSRVMMTTRLSNLAYDLGSADHVVELSFLDEDKSWLLFCQKVFAQEGCPPELEDVGRKIVEYCKGLPLSIVVIGGLLAKSHKTQNYWEYIATNVSSTIYLENDRSCSKILYLSYKHLPIHLKPCFLHLGVFPEDHEINISKLIKIWVAEEFLKPVNSKSLEEVAEEYIRDLVDRNLILVRKRGACGKIRTCNIHDLLRELCLREAEKEKVFHILRPHKVDRPIDISRHRRLVIDEDRFTLRTLKNERPSGRVYHDLLQSAPFARSLTICGSKRIYGGQSLRLLRVLNELGQSYGSGVEILPVSLRFIAMNAYVLRSLSSIVGLLNLQTLIVTVKLAEDDVVVPCEIWGMHRLRHLEIKPLFCLDDLPANQMKRRDDSEHVLENLQTILEVRDFRLSKEVVKRIPNIKKLRIGYFGNALEKSVDLDHYCLSNLRCFKNLESLSCISRSRRQNVAFPHSLKKLTLRGWHLRWEVHMKMIGSLPHLEVLKLWSGAFVGSVWEPAEGEFLRLKFLAMDGLNLERWTADNTHFPRLEHLVLSRMSSLVEIPLGLADIPTLQSMKLIHCTNSVIISAKAIVEELESFGNENFQVQVICGPEKIKELEYLASSTFTFARQL